MEKILFLINPLAGRRAGTTLKGRIRSELNAGVDLSRYEIQFTESDALPQVRGALCGYDTVVVAGGDGTISQAVREIVGCTPRPKIGIIPVGTGNDLAGSLGLVNIYRSCGLRALLDIILRGKTTPLDIVVMNDGLCFTNYFGIGADAKISNDFNRLRTQTGFQRICSSRLGKALYGLLGLKNARYRIPAAIELDYLDTHTIRRTVTLPPGMCGLVVSNARTYAGGVVLSARAGMNDGLFEVTVFKNMRQRIMMLFAMLARAPLSSVCPGIVQFQTGALHLHLHGNTFYQLDGEFFDGRAAAEKSLQFSIAAAADVIVP